MGILKDLHQISESRSLDQLKSLLKETDDTLRTQHPAVYASAASSASARYHIRHEEELTLAAVSVASAR